MPNIIEIHDLSHGVKIMTVGNDVKRIVLHRQGQMIGFDRCGCRQSVPRKAAFIKKIAEISQGNVSDRIDDHTFAVQNLLPVQIDGGGSRVARKHNVRGRAKRNAARQQRTGKKPTDYR